MPRQKNRKPSPTAAAKIGAQVATLTKGRAGANITHGVISAAFFAGFGLFSGLACALGLPSVVRFYRADFLQGVDAQSKGTATVERYDLGAQAARRDVARPVRAGCADVHAANVDADFFGVQFALDGLGHNAKVGALDAGRFYVGAGDVQQQRLGRVADR